MSDIAPTHGEITYLFSSSHVCPVIPMWTQTAMSGQSLVSFYRHLVLEMDGNEPCFFRGYHLR